MVLLPKLRLYNGKDITSSANHLRFVYTEHLKTRVSSATRWCVSSFVLVVLSCCWCLMSRNCVLISDSGSLGEELLAPLANHKGENNLGGEKLHPHGSPAGEIWAKFCQRLY